MTAQPLIVSVEGCGKRRNHTYYGWIYRWPAVVTVRASAWFPCAAWSPGPPRPAAIRCLA